MTEIMNNQYFEFAVQTLNKGSNLGTNVIRIPVVWAAEIVKDYPEFDGKMLMTFEEIEAIVKTHETFTITDNHVRMTDKNGKLAKIPANLNLGTIKDLKADSKCRCGRGTAFINKNKVSTFIANMLMRGGVIGISGGGFAEKIGPGGHHKGENFIGSQMGVTMHHMALVSRGIPRCPTNVCGFNLKEMFIDAKNPSLIDSCVSKKLTILNEEHLDWTQAHRVAESILQCKLKDSIESSFIFVSDILAPSSFIDFYDYLIHENLIVPESCANDFYIEFKNAWLTSEGVGIIKDQDNHLDINQNLLKNDEMKMAENQLKRIQELEAENKKLQDAQLKGATGTIETLRDANAKMATEMAALKLSLVESNKVAKVVQDNKAAAMVKILTESINPANNLPVYSAQELSTLPFLELEKTFNLAKRFLNLPELDNSMMLVQQQPIYQPPNPFLNQAPPQYYAPNQGYSVPTYAPQAPTGQNKQPQMYDAQGNIMTDQNVLNQSRVVQVLPVPGSVPSTEEIFDEKNPRWKSNDPNEDKNLNDPRGAI